MLNEVLKLTQGDLTMFSKNRKQKCKHGIDHGRECEECIKEQHTAFRGKELERNNEAFYKDSIGEGHE